MQTNKRATLLIILCLFLSLVNAQEEKFQPKFALETNTTPWIFGGYALGINVGVSSKVGLLIGIAGNADFSPFIVDVFKPQNSDKGIDWEVKQAYVLAIDYYLQESQKGWYVGWFNFVFENEIGKAREFSRFTSHTALVRVGYRYYPGNGNKVYLNPWGGIGSEYKWYGNQTTSNAKWITSDFAYFVSLNAGISF